MGQSADTFVLVIWVSRLVGGLFGPDFLKSKQQARSFYPKLKTKLTMSAIFLLIAFSLLVALGFLGAFIWAVRSGQYDDDYTPSVRMLFDERNGEKEKKATAEANN